MQRQQEHETRGQWLRFFFGQNKITQISALPKKCKTIKQVLVPETRIYDTNKKNGHNNSKNSSFKPLLLLSVIQQQRPLRSNVVFVIVFLLFLLFSWKVNHAFRLTKLHKIIVKTKPRRNYSQSNNLFLGWWAMAKEKETATTDYLPIYPWPEIRPTRPTTKTTTEREEKHCKHVYVYSPTEKKQS